MDCSNGDERRALASSRCEFSKKCRRISIKNMPPGITNQDISDILKPYHYQQIHIDKMSLSCKAVLLDGESACRCVNDLNMKFCRGSRLVVSPASCDFMLCVTQLPEHYTREQFLTLITPFGTPERCFLVHSETSGRSKGYGCVEYTSKESSIRAKNHLNGKVVATSTVQVHWLDAIPQSYSGLHSSCIFIENVPISHKDAKSLGQLFSCKNIRPVFCQSAYCAVDDFSVIEYSTPSEAESMWVLMSGYNIGGRKLRVTFCVPGPCGLVILNSLKASRDLKRNNPTGGLLPTPLHKLDPMQFPGKPTGNNGLPPSMPILAAPLTQALTNKDPEVQRLLRALHSRLLNMPEPVQQFHPHEINSRPFPAHADGRVNGFDAHSVNQQSNPSTRGRSASYDSGVHAADDDVFSSGSSSQEDVGRTQEQQHASRASNGNWETLPAKIRLDTHLQDHPSAFCQISSNSDANRVFNSQPQALLACQKEDLQRSNSADSAYDGGQEKVAPLKEQTFHFPAPVLMSDYANQVTLQNLPTVEGYQMPLPRRVCGVSKESNTFPRINGVSRPEFLFSSLCKDDGLQQKRKDPNEVAEMRGASFTQHRSQSTRTPLRDFSSSPCFQRKGLTHDSPTQLQLLGSSLMEGLLAESPRPNPERFCENGAVSMNSGRLLRALNLLSPTECLNSPHTPMLMKKRTNGMLPSPEPSPEAGAYVGQHSQGLGGHYAGALLGNLFANKRKKSNEI